MILQIDGQFCPEVSCPAGRHGCGPAGHATVGGAGVAGVSPANVSVSRPGGLGPDDGWVTHEIRERHPEDPCPEGQCVPRSQLIGTVWHSGDASSARRCRCAGRTRPAAGDSRLALLSYSCMTYCLVALPCAVVMRKQIDSPLSSTEVVGVLDGSWLAPSLVGWTI